MREQNIDNNTGVDATPVAVASTEMIDCVTVDTPDCLEDMNQNLVQRRKFAPPQTREEKLIAQIWQELLEIDNIGIHDNFLLLGGESLLATQAVTRLREAFEVEVPIRSILLGTIAEIAVEVVIETEVQEKLTQAS